LFSREFRPIQLANLSRFRTELYGGFAIWILLFHLHEWGIFALLKGSAFPEKLLRHFLTLGSLGVDAFLILSGISLYFSITKRPSISEYAARRISRLLPSAALLFGGIWIYSFTFLEGDIPQLIVRFAGISLWFEGNKTGTWYVSAILVCYFLYPYIYSWLFSNRLSEWKLIERWSLLLLLSLVCFWAMHKLNLGYFKMIEIALGRIPSFLIGCLLGKGIYEKKTISGRWKMPIVLGAVLFFVVVRPEHSWHWWTRCLYPVGGALALFVFVLILDAIDGLQKGSEERKRHLNLIFLRKSGTISLELYLGSVAFLSVLKIIQTSCGSSAPTGNPWMQLILSVMFFSGSYLIALTAHVILDVLNRIRERRTKSKCQ
jgi:peptidoglycan/LPS O-acetylase OafA/YrhL